MLSTRSNSERARRHARWQRELKHYLFEKLGIRRCESCGTTYGLSIAHARKRRFLKTREDYFRAAVLCLEEHQKLDEATGNNPHGRMAAFIDRLIQQRTANADYTGA